jgi:hypothetical protein
MNQTADLSAELAANPPAELRELLNDPRTTDSARAAVADVAKPPPTTTNGSKSSSSQLGDGRLQVVNETQEFTLVIFCIAVMKLNGQEGLIPLPRQMGFTR